MIKQPFILAILISSVVLNQGNHDDIISPFDDDNSIQQNINITCFCTGDAQCDLQSSTCQITHPDHACYEAWEKSFNDNTIDVTAGCVSNTYLWRQLWCNGNKSDRYVICCTGNDYCNDRDAYSSDIRKQLSSSSNFNYKPVNLLVIYKLFIVTVCIVMISCLFLFILFRIKRKKNFSLNQTQSNLKRHLLKYKCLQAKHSTIDIFPDTESIGSDRGSIPDLVPIRFSNQVTLDKKIGVGGFGRVYSGKWMNKTVIAIKVFPAHDEPSWQREVFIYETLGLNHENILRFITADHIDVSGYTEHWIATEYHSNGSVYDYLHNHTITIPIMIKMMHSIVSGLFHLHTPIDSARGKVSLAHRDLKTKNILVKQDLSCCIADLGLAVKEKREVKIDKENPTVIDIIANHRAGTIRYMAPEILNKTLNDQSFESYKATDLYALGLVFWEMLRRCQTTPEENDTDDYQLPYEDILPNNPSLEQMHDVVCIQKFRPLPSSRWKNNSILSYIFEQSEELWLENPACRPSSCRIETQLSHQLQSIEIISSHGYNEQRIESPQTI
ncbi:unnamed protein product [Adineta steineri]|uniref:receptor protein serine/threonine kinase n=1 Tax=Adineta steineri TaxID=433720 RepID=A0A814UAV7_9BILA|nr:unnamed protein product [Adineta steineri]CAF3626027.1 unnamed protein product [Adineta steineri]